MREKRRIKVVGKRNKCVLEKRLPELIHIACIVITRALVNLVSNHMTIFPQNSIFAGL